MDTPKDYLKEVDACYELLNGLILVQKCRMIAVLNFNKAEHIQTSKPRATRTHPISKVLQGATIGGGNSIVAPCTMIALIDRVVGGAGAVRMLPSCGRFLLCLWPYVC